MDIISSMRICHQPVLHIADLNGKLFAVSGIDGNLYNLDLNYFVVSQKFKAHADMITSIVSLQKKVCVASTATPPVCL